MISKRFLVIWSFLFLLAIGCLLTRQKPQNLRTFDPPLTLEDWMDRTIDREFKAFQGSGFSREMLEKTWEKGRLKHRTIQRFQVIDSKVYGEDGFMKRLLQRIVEKYPLPDVDFLYHKEDRFSPSFFKMKEIKYGAPILVSAKHHTFDRAILFCDYFYDIDDEKKGWNRMIQEVESNQEKWPWESKEEKLFWRGGPTDGRYKVENWTLKPRGALVHQTTLYPELIDARFSEYPKRLDTKPEEFEQAIGPISYVSIPEQLKYKYHVIADGVTTAFTGSYWKLLSGCLCFMQESEDIMFFHGPLLPWKHYIPVKKDFSDLVEKIEWAKEHDLEAKAIAENARAFAKSHLMPEHILLYSYKTLLKYASLQKFQPERL
jgi:hypothetical protein